MIVGTEGTPPDITEQENDTNPGPGSPRNEGETEPSDQPKTADQAQQTGQGKKAAEEGTQADQSSPTKATGKSDQSAQKAQAGGSGSGGNANDPGTIIARSQALADAMKPLETPASDLNDPVKRKAVEDAYAKAIGESGDLRVKLNDAHKKFDRAAADMKPRMADWLKLLEKDQPIGKLLQKRCDLEAALTDKQGPLEKKRADAQASAKTWADANGNWAAPAEKMTALVGQYADKIDKLNADINNDVNANSAMLSFWFEVAPRHMQIDDRALSTEAQQSVDQVSAKLAEYGLGNLLKNGKARNDGSLYVVADSKELTKARTDFFGAWSKAAETLAGADAEFKLNPDDAASQKQQFDKLKDDAWLQEAKKQLLDQAAS